MHQVFKGMTEVPSLEYDCVMCLQRDAESSPKLCQLKHAQESWDTSLWHVKQHTYAEHSYCWTVENPYYLSVVHHCITTSDRMK